MRGRRIKVLCGVVGLSCCFCSLLLFFSNLCIMCFVACFFLFMRVVVLE